MGVSKDRNDGIHVDKDNTIQVSQVKKQLGNRYKKGKWISVYRGKLATFMVAKQNVPNPMPTHKVKNIFSEIGTFFKENDAKSAMNTIIDMT